MENNQNIKYIVYITTNMVNGKIYIGVHGTETPDKFDGYLGNSAWANLPNTYNKGKYPIHAAILKYGPSNFRRNVIKVFDSKEEALKMEAELVTEEFIKQSNNYNATVGGGIPPKSNKKVNQYDLRGVYIKTWDSEVSITNYFKCKASISKVIKNKRNFAGYFWTWEDQKEINIEEYAKTSRFGFVDQYDLEGNYITSYKNANMASQKLDIDFKRICRAIFRMTPCSGYYF